MKRRQIPYAFVTLTCMAVLCWVVPLPAQSTESMMSQGNMLLSNGAFDQAVSVFRKVIARDPSNFEAQFNLGYAYLNWGRYSNAVTEFKRALRINPASAECWSNIAMAYQNLGQSQNAIDALYRAVQQNPNNITARINLATMYGQNKHWDKAIGQYKQVLQIDGTNLDATVNLAKCLISQGKEKEAKHYLKSAMAINPNDAEAYWEYANVLWNKDKDTEGALTNYRKAIALQPNSQVYYENLGLLLEELWKKNKDESKRKEAVDVWKKYLIYLDDALKKERIQDRLDMIERGESPSGKATTEELFGKNKLQKEEKISRESGEEGGGTKTIQVETYDVGGDLNDLSKEEEGKGDAFDFDMKKAVKEKKKALKKEE
jgi:Flp pilus assembly protein TadD